MILVSFVERSKMKVEDVTLDPNAMMGETGV